MNLSIKVPWMRVTKAGGSKDPPLRSFIQTLTVGLGISPNQPIDGFNRVVDFNHRFGITPTPGTTCGLSFSHHQRDCAMQPPSRQDHLR